MRGLVLIVVVLVVVIGMRALVRRLKAADAAARNDDGARELPSPWRAVTIRTGDPACSAARRLEGQRFLLSEAPSIPLPDCDIEDCTCEYAHYEDRRSGHERRDAYDIRTRSRGSADADKRKGERRNR